MTDAYTAYSYLIAGQDFRSFELAPEFGRVPPYAAALTAGQQQRAQRLLRDSLVISLHDHPVRFPLRTEETPGYNRTGRQHAAYAEFSAKPALGTAMITAAADVGAPFGWVVADEVCGRSGKLREACQKGKKGYVVAGPANFTVTLPSGRKTAATASPRALGAALPQPDRPF